MAARTHAGERLIDDLQHGQHRLGAERPADRREVDAEPGPLATLPFRSAPDACQECVAERGDDLLEDAAGIGTARERGVERRDGRLGIPSGDRLHEPADLLLPPRADHGVHCVDVDHPCRRSEQLLEQRLAVAHAARSSSRDQRERLGRCRAPLGLHDLLEPSRDRRGVDRDEVEPLAPRENGDRKLFGLGGAEHEFDVRRRLLECLQEGVERLPCEHVHFVDDVHLEPPAGRPHGDVLPQLSDLIDATIAGGVDLHHVDILPRRDRRTVVAGVAGLGGRAALTLERLGVDPRGARLADAAGPREQIGVADPAALDRARETTGHVLLADELVEPLGAVAAGDDLIGGRCGHERLRRKRAGRR